MPPGFERRGKRRPPESRRENSRGLYTLWKMGSWLRFPKEKTKGDFGYSCHGLCRYFWEWKAQAGSFGWVTWERQ